MKSDIIYLKLEQNSQVSHKKVLLEDVAEILTADQTLQKESGKLVLYTFSQEKEQKLVFSAMKVIELLQKQRPGLQVINIGETDFIVTYEEQDGKGGIIHGVKIVAVVLISFFGAAFSTMAFNNDVGVTRMFGQVYELLTGTKSDGFTILEFTYCIGIVIGILTFFNHFGKKRLSVDPTPMEVEMRLYENDIQTTLVETYSRKEKELDVGEKHMSGTTGI